MRLSGAVTFTALLAGCSTSQAPVPQVAKRPPAVPNITQLYASKPAIARGEHGLVCYGVENASKVTLSPPRQELSAALSRCVEVTPTETTAYTLTAEDQAGHTATRTVTVTVGPPRAHIVEVRVSELEVVPGDPISICYKVENARSVRIDPVHFQAGAMGEGCTVAHPIQTTRYTVTATGAAGDTDTEQVTVRVR